MHRNVAVARRRPDGQHGTAMSDEMQAAPSIEHGAGTGAPQIVGISARPRRIIEALWFPRHDDRRAP